MNHCPPNDNKTASENYIMLQYTNPIQLDVKGAGNSLCLHLI